MANPVGRPTRYTPELLEKARRYLTDYADFGDEIPSIAGLACVIGVVRETCHAWDKDPEKEEFSNILRELGQRQERKLLNSGLKGDFNAPIAKMILSKHGYSDAQAVMHGNNPDNPMPAPFTGFVIERAQPDTPEAD